MLVLISLHKLKKYIDQQMFRMYHSNPIVDCLQCAVELILPPTVLLNHHKLIKESIFFYGWGSDTERRGLTKKSTSPGKHCLVSLHCLLAELPHLSNSDKGSNLFPMLPGKLNNPHMWNICNSASGIIGIQKILFLSDSSKEASLALEPGCKGKSAGLWILRVYNYSRLPTLSLTLTETIKYQTA